MTKMRRWEEVEALPPMLMGATASNTRMKSSASSQEVTMHSLNRDARQRKRENCMKHWRRSGRWRNRRNRE
jgi:hypothetical protein